VASIIDIYIIQNLIFNISRVILGYTCTIYVSWFCVEFQHCTLSASSVFLPTVLSFLLQLLFFIQLGSQNVICRYMVSRVLSVVKCSKKFIFSLYTWKIYFCLRTCANPLSMYNKDKVKVKISQCLKHSCLKVCGSLEIKALPHSSACHWR
jgi:hypothetical protein